ncbi:MAG: PqqD family protein [Firmicutes bacterium]|nr:PqqD family protein [Bacillota bacterium]
MKLNKDFLLHHTGSESVLVPTGAAAFSGVVRGNQTLGAVLELLREDVTEAEIVAALKARFEAPAGVIEADVERVVTELRSIGALDE